MGLSQSIFFESDKIKIEVLLDKLKYQKITNTKYLKDNQQMKIELFVEPFGFVIHRSGEYFYEFGLLIESLGNICSRITIEDN